MWSIERGLSTSPQSRSGSDRRASSLEAGSGGQTAGAGRPLAGASLLALFLALCLIWGFTYVTLKIGLRDAPPLAFSFGRALVGGLALGAYALATAGRFPRDAATHRAAAILGLTNVAAFWGLMNLGLTRVSAGESSILTYTQPLLVAVLARAWLGEALSLRATLGLLLGFAGVAAVVANKLQIAGQPAWLGYAFTLAGALAWAVGTVYFRARQAGLDLVWVTTLQALYGAVPLLALSLLLEHQPVTPSTSLLWTLAYTGLGSSALAYLIWFYLLRHRATAEVTSFIFLVPLSAVLFGALVLGERLSLISLLGAGLILAGIYVVSRRPAATRRTT